MAVSITELLPRAYDAGVFAYVIPFLLIFAIIYGILYKAQIFGNSDKVKGVNAIIAAAIGLLSLQFGIVTSFFEIIFPRFGLGLAIFLVLVIAIGFFVGPGKVKNLQWIGWVIGLGVVIWAWDEWSYFSGSGNFVDLIGEWFWPIIIVVVIIGGIIGVTGGFGKNTAEEKEG